MTVGSYQAMKQWSLYLKENLNFSGEVTELRINFDYSGTSYDVGLSNFNLSSKFIGNFDTLNSSVTLRPINFLIENKYSGNAFSI